MHSYKTLLTRLALRFPKTVMAATLLMTGIFLFQFPKVRFDNDPENMLSADEPVRVFHHEVKERFGLYDFVIAGFVNETHPDGVFNTGTLAQVHRLTEQLASLRRGADGSALVSDSLGGETAVDLTPESFKDRVLMPFFRHDVKRLFSEQGQSAIIAAEIISPSSVDSLRQADLGQLKMEFLMEKAPATREEALRIRDDAMNNPLYRDTLVSADGKALCLFIPLQDKTFSYNVANLVRALTKEWQGDDELFITGLPVAEDTFGVEMLVQMAESAPMAMLVIFGLLFFFFRRLSLIVAPLLLAMIIVLATMGLLIGLGFDVHIMSSMIAIFLMPIAVADSVHMLSEFHDVYPRFRDKHKTVLHLVEHLFSPMLFTSLTTIAGFASLAFTPIPPVQVFGMHIAFGVALAWVLTMTFVPAYILLFGKVQLVEAPSSASGSAVGEAHQNVMSRFLQRLGRVSYARSRGVMIGSLVLLVIAVYGVTTIQVNDNPVKWFTAKHRIRVADEVLNRHFGGTYTAYLELEATGLEERNELTREEIRAAVKGVPVPGPELNIGRLLTRLALVPGEAGNDEVWAALRDEASLVDESVYAPWTSFAGAVAEEDPESFDAAIMDLLVERHLTASLLATRKFKSLRPSLEGLAGVELQDRIADICDEATVNSLQGLVEDLEIELTVPIFKLPAMLAYVEQFQRALEAHPKVGKTSSAVDAVKKAHYELNFNAAAKPDENEAAFSIPAKAAGVGQVFTQLEGMKKKDSLFHMVSRDYNKALIWIQLTSGDNREMNEVVQAAEEFFTSTPAPQSLKMGWAGLTYINVVWQDKMVNGMLSSLLGSFLMVLGMMVVLFRSPLLGLLAMAPLTITILLIYGLIGLTGKDYDMPVAVLSALTLGLSVDFAIHFIQRARELVRSEGSLEKALPVLFGEPARAITRNAIVIAVGFLPLLVAPLVPYRTVGFFMASIMVVSWVSTLILLTALFKLLEKRIFKNNPTTKEPVS